MSWLDVLLDLMIIVSIGLIWVLERGLIHLQVCHWLILIAMGLVHLLVHLGLLIILWELIRSHIILLRLLPRLGWKLRLIRIAILIVIRLRIVHLAELIRNGMLVRHIFERMIVLVYLRNSILLHLMMFHVYLLWNLFHMIHWMRLGMGRQMIFKLWLHIMFLRNLFWTYMLRIIKWSCVEGSSHFSIWSNGRISMKSRLNLKMLVVFLFLWLRHVWIGLSHGLQILGMYR